MSVNTITITNRDVIIATSLFVIVIVLNSPFNFEKILKIALCYFQYLFKIKGRNSERLERYLTPFNIFINYSYSHILIIHIHCVKQLLKQQEKAWWQVVRYYDDDGDDDDAVDYAVDDNDTFNDN